METRVFSAEKVDGKSLFAPAYPSELPTNLGSRNTRLSWLAIRGKSTGVEDSWLLPAPVNRHDLRSFKRRPVPYDGCMWTGDGNSCTWSEMSATVVVYENIKTPPRNSLGVCGSAGKSELSPSQQPRAKMMNAYLCLLTSRNRLISHTLLTV